MLRYRLFYYREAVLSGRIFLIRHGEVDWNAANSYVGVTDAPLNDRGLEQARRVAHFLKNREIVRVFSSSRQRAFRTAATIAEQLGVEVETVREFDEMNYGVWEGVPETRVKQLHPELYAAWQVGSLDDRIPDGETLRELLERAIPAFHRIADAHRDECTAIVAHKSVNRLILATILLMNPSHYRRILQGNACVNEIELRADGTYVVDSVNQQEHLGDLVQAR